MTSHGPDLSNDSPIAVNMELVVQLCNVGWAGWATRDSHIVMSM